MEKVSYLMQFANQDDQAYDPKLLLNDEEIRQIKDRNKDNEDVKKLLNDLEMYKQIVMMYESL